MGDKRGTPIEFFTWEEAGSILTIALKWGPNETKKLREATQSNFEKVLTVIQASSELAEIVWDIIGNDKSWSKRHFTPQEIIKFRRTILSLLNGEENDDEEEEESSDQHASPELAQIAVTINALYANWTYFNNMKVLTVQVHDFFEELWKNSKKDEEEKQSWGVTVKQKNYLDNDEEDDDDFSGWNYYQILAGDAIVVKTIKSIIYAYIFYLRKLSDTDLGEIWKTEESSELWQGMAQIVTNYKRFVKQPRNMRSVRNMNFDLIAELEEIFESWDSYALLLNTKRGNKAE